MTAGKPYLKSAGEAAQRLGLSGARRGAEQGFTMLTRLERQKAMLEKQALVWLRQQILTEHRLRKVQAEILKVRASLQALDAAPVLKSQGTKNPGLKPGAAAAAAGRPKRVDIDFSF